MAQLTGSGGDGGALGKKTAASSHVLAALAKSRGQSGSVCALALASGLAKAGTELCFAGLLWETAEVEVCCQEEEVQGWQTCTPQQEDSRIQPVGSPKFLRLKIVTAMWSRASPILRGKGCGHQPLTHFLSSTRMENARAASE